MLPANSLDVELGDKTSVNPTRIAGSHIDVVATVFWNVLVAVGIFSMVLDALVADTVELRIWRLSNGFANTPIICMMKIKCTS